MSTQKPLGIFPRVVNYDMMDGLDFHGRNPRPDGLGSQTLLTTSYCRTTIPWHFGRNQWDDVETLELKAKYCGISAADMLSVAEAAVIDADRQVKRWSTGDGTTFEEFGGCLIVRIRQSFAFKPNAQSKLNPFVRELVRVIEYQFATFIPRIADIDRLRGLFKADRSVILAIDDVKAVGPRSTRNFLRNLEPYSAEKM